ncbi:putative nitrate reductase [Leucogyrophana mollusca]|uniref:Nitrate reductase n=1 Tax=Leucogyrophana mollusca TaxID=85980 RepID=A0ACB8B333_9AGAM|nr:putative nitrate reductase [Leucogyrophana mollusca]
MSATAVPATRFKHANLKVLLGNDLPPSPPATEDLSSNSTDSAYISDGEPVTIPLPPPSNIATAVLDLDKATPDSHVPRDHRLIRLTGVHPFNVEPPLNDLFENGFLTPPELFFVRNHGPVPQICEQDVANWDFSIEGLVERPMMVSLKQLISEFEQITIPATLVCAGNRRKEQNQVRKSNGFSWGPSGLSTALFTGVLMSQVLQRARPTRRAKFVCMEGCDKLPNGSYGTSIRLSLAMDPAKGVMLAHMMNGEQLTLDHGLPLRVVVPGQIGGRSVKWLRRLILTDTPSENWYHIFDNRVLPTSVSPEEASNNHSWWKDERYVIKDLNVNSAIARPAHNEKVSAKETDTYVAKGYAYAGGGRRVSRVEVSLDKGRTWRLADIDYPEDLYRDADDYIIYNSRLDMGWRDTCFCWCFWSIDIPIVDLKNASDIVVRAMDEAMNLQPKDMYWSVLGMMNNPWFRVVIHAEGDEIWFEHPTLPALMPGGWMERVQAAGGDLTNGAWGEKIGDGQSVVVKATEIKMTNDAVKRDISIEELQQHGESPWFVVDGNVYDGTAYLNEHPGGPGSIIAAAGLDVTEEFTAIHSEVAKAMMSKYHIGSLDAAGRAVLHGNDEAVADDDSPSFLDRRAWKPATLISKVHVSWDTRLFTFSLSRADQVIGLPIGQHLLMRVRHPKTQEIILRAYTPISETSKRGVVDVLVKLYLGSDTRAGGKMTMALDALPIHSTIDFKGPLGRFEYLGRGRVLLSDKPAHHVSTFVMICGGSGITPIFQVLRAIMQDDGDRTQCVVLDGNRRVEDILCRQELDGFVAIGGTTKCKIIHTLSQPGDEEGWSGLRGRIDQKLIREHAGGLVRDDTMVLVCGPDALEKNVHSILLDEGWKEEQLVFF